MPLIKEIISCIEENAPLALQESYDNAGLICGNPEEECSGVLLTLDCNEKIVEEALQKKCNLIISHHPVLFKPLKKITTKDYVGRTLLKALQGGVTLYASHTNADNVIHGVNHIIAGKLGLKNRQILSPKRNLLKKLVVFVPEEHLESVSEAVFAAGAGKIGNYDSCSFRASGTGTFRGGENTNPFVGKKNVLNKEPEVRFETIFPGYLEKQIIAAMLAVHPYEEPAYDLYSLENSWNQVGSGLLGELDKELTPEEFLRYLSESMDIPFIRYTNSGRKTVKKVALCGGSGSFLINEAKSRKADIFITSDIKYHDFFEGEEEIMLVDIGHFEAEKYTVELFFQWITKKFPKFAVRFSETNIHPVKYFVR